MTRIDPDLCFTREDCERYHELGYALLGNVLTEDSLGRMRQEVDRVLRERHPTVETDQIFAVHQTERWLLEVVGEAPLLDIVEQIIGPNIVVWSTNLLCKPPKSGRSIPWHQDLPYWSVGGKLATIWIALDDLDDENGTMYVLPGYHQKGALRQHKISTEFFTDEIEPSELPDDVDQREVGYFLKAGEAAMHHELIPHRSSRNRSSERWRRVLAIRYMMAEGQMPQRQYPNYQTAEKVDRQFVLVRGADVAGRGLVRSEI